MTNGFRLGTTSYIVPDDILPNLRFLAGQVDDVELVLFESDEFSNIPTPDAVEQMRALGRQHDMTFTVHLPLDTELGSGDEAVRVASLGKCLRVIERMAPLEPFAWVLHLHGDHRGLSPSEDMGRWLAQHDRSLEALVTAVGAPRMLCVETLDYDFQLVADLVQRHDLAVCLDIGHLVVHGRDVGWHLDAWIDRTRVLHIHGVNEEGRDHVDVTHLPEGVLDGVLDALRRGSAVPRVLTMEVFGQADFETSLRTIAERLQACPQ